MKNPLIKRLPRELKGEIGKYIVLFLFITMMIGIVSGFLVAAGSMSVTYDESFEKYNIESGNFELLQKADDDAIKKIEDGEEKIKVYENFYLDKETKEVLKKYAYTPASRTSLFLPVCHFATLAAQLPVYAHLLAIHHRRA